ncbi:claudin 10-like 2 [Trichomycterus rosablanca]|uniref:claudin 10-like 2 n=1 Tax=Trichomycterus rosablanca TaxID=2290929 RepID=UPI002F3587A1
MNTILIQVLGFLSSTFGWFFVSSTMAMDYWRVSYIGGQGGSWIIKAAWYWSTLWRDCYIDSTSVANCRDYDTLWIVRPANWAEQGYIRAVRALLLFSMFVGLFAAIFSFIGMDCTYIGGKEKTKDKILVIGSALHFVGGTACLAAYSLFTVRLGRAAFAPVPNRGILRYEIGPPVYFGLVGSVCIILGSIMYAVTLYRIFIPKRNVDTAKKQTVSKSKALWKKSKTLYKGDRDDAVSTQSRSSSPSSLTSSQESRSSKIIEVSERDSFV